jgi:DNA (cytosine-5)-methyltransferase 1
MLTSRGLGIVLGDLAEMGYDARWGVFSAADVGARHERERMWIMGNSKCCVRIARTDRTILPKDYGTKRNFRYPQVWCKNRFVSEMGSESITISYYNEPPPPESMRVVDDVASELDRLKAIGNGQVSAVVKLAWENLKGN